MKVKELINILKEANPDANVIFNTSDIEFNDIGFNDIGFKVFDILKSLQDSGDVYIILDS